MAQPDDQLHRPNSNDDVLAAASTAQRAAARLRPPCEWNVTVPHCPLLYHAAAPARWSGKVAGCRRAWRAVGREVRLHGLRLSGGGIVLCPHRVLSSNTLGLWGVE